MIVVESNSRPSILLVSKLSQIISTYIPSQFASRIHYEPTKISQRNQIQINLAQSPYFLITCRLCLTVQETSNIIPEIKTPFQNPKPRVQSSLSSARTDHNNENSLVNARIPFPRC